MVLSGTILTVFCGMTKSRDIIRKQCGNNFINIETEKGLRPLVLVYAGEWCSERNGYIRQQKLRTA